MALIVLAGADHVFDPIPVPAATATAGGLFTLWLRGGLRPRVIGIAIGLGVGVALHVVVHVTGRSPSPEEGMALHVVTDGIRGLLVALLAVTTAALVHSLP
jgi:hypothetical protein